MSLVKFGHADPQGRDAPQECLDGGIVLKLTTGADNHIVPDFVSRLWDGRLLSLADSANVRVEPPHHVARARLEDLFFDICLGGHIPLLTHPERLSWIESKYDVTQGLAARPGSVPAIWPSTFLARGLSISWRRGRAVGGHEAAWRIDEHVTETFAQSVPCGKEGVATRCRFSNVCFPGSRRFF